MPREGKCDSQKEAGGQSQDGAGQSQLAPEALSQTREKPDGQGRRAARKELILTGKGRRSRSRLLVRMKRKEMKLG